MSILYQTCAKRIFFHGLEQKALAVSFQACVLKTACDQQIVQKSIHSKSSYQTLRHLSLSTPELTSAKKRLDVSSIPSIKEFISESTESSYKYVPNEQVDEDPPPYLQTAVYSEPPNGRTVYFETYGCQMNVNDTEYAWAVLKNAGYKRVTELYKADVVLLVTCSIREKAEEKIWKKLRVLKKHKQTYHTFGYPKIGVLGCMAERLKKQIIEQQQAVDIVAGPDAYRDLPRLLEQATSESTTAVNVMLSVDETYADIMPVRFDDQSKTAFVSIMRGCDNMCSYCIVPFTRGRERSRPVDSIIDEIKQLSDMGFKQVTLLGQNVNSYRDLSQQQHESFDMAAMSRGFKTIYKPRPGGLRFADLLDKVSEVNPEMRVRFTSPHPKDFPDEVLEIISERPNICNHIHLPVQSGSTKMLDLMRRGHTREDYLQLVDRVRSFIPGVTISTDLITGFCFEEERDHQDTLSLLELVKYNYAFMFMYSMRKKTHAYHKMEDTVPQEVKSERLQEILGLYQKCLPEANDQYLDTTQLVLVEKKCTKRSEAWTSRMDGNVKVYFPDVVLPASSATEPAQHATVGDYVAVKLTSYKPNSFTATPLFRTTLTDFYARKIS